MAAVGCGASAAEQTFSERDLLAIAATQAPVPHGMWTRHDYERPATYAVDKLPSHYDDDLMSPHAWAAFRDRVGDGDIVRGAYSTWRNENTFADAVQFLFRDSGEAHTAVTALIDTYKREGDPGFHVADVRRDGLGEDAWGWQVSSSRVVGAFYAWRRGNLVIFAFIDCGSGVDDRCDYDAAEAARAYAHALDEQARES